MGNHGKNTMDAGGARGTRASRAEDAGAERGRRRRERGRRARRGPRQGAGPTHARASRGPNRGGSNVQQGGGHEDGPRWRARRRCVGDDGARVRERGGGGGGTRRRRGSQGTHEMRTLAAVPQRTSKGGYTAPTPWQNPCQSPRTLKTSRFFPSRRTMSGRVSRTPSALSFADYGRDFYRSKSALRQRAEIMPTLRTPRLPLAISRKCGY